MAQQDIRAGRRARCCCKDPLCAVTPLAEPARGATQDPLYDLDNGIHPIFRKSNFVGITQERDYECLKPSLRMSSHLLEWSPLVEYLDTLVSGVVRDANGRDVDLTTISPREYMDGMLSVWPRSDPQASTTPKRNAELVLEDLAEMIEIHALPCPCLRKLSNTGEQNVSLGAVRSSGTGTSPAAAIPKSAGTTYPPRRRFSTHHCSSPDGTTEPLLKGPLPDRVARRFPNGVRSKISLNAKTLYMLRYLTEHEDKLPFKEFYEGGLGGIEYRREDLLWLRFLVAQILVHEILGHALHFAVFGPPKGPREIRYRDSKLAKTGWEVEKLLFGGEIFFQNHAEANQNTSSAGGGVNPKLQAFPRGTFGFCKLPSFRIAKLYRERYGHDIWCGAEEKEVEVDWEIPQSAVALLFTKDFWAQQARLDRPNC